jgi:hypothetical protein
MEKKEKRKLLFKLAVTVFVIAAVIVPAVIGKGAFTVELAVMILAIPVIIILLIVLKVVGAWARWMMR